MSRFTGGWYLAEDLTQDVLIRIFSVLGRVSRTGAPKAYASPVLVNLNRSWLRLASAVGTWERLPIHSGLTVPA